MRNNCMLQQIDETLEAHYHTFQIKSMFFDFEQIKSSRAFFPFWFIYIQIWLDGPIFGHHIPFDYISKSIKPIKVKCGKRDSIFR